MGAATKIVVPGVARLPAFCHAVIAGDFIYVSGMLGAEPASTELVEWHSWSGRPGPRCQGRNRLHCLQTSERSD